VEGNEPIIVELERTRRAYDSLRSTARAPDFAGLELRPLRRAPVLKLAAAAAIVFCVTIAALVLRQGSDSRVGETPAAALQRPAMPASLDIPNVSVSLDFERMRSELAGARQCYPWLGSPPTSPDSRERKNDQNGST
jgi:hypothetical protein